MSERTSERASERYLQSIYSLYGLERKMRDLGLARGIVPSHKQGH